MLESLDLLATPIPWALGFLALMVIELSTSGFVAGFMGFGALLTAFAVQWGVAPTPGAAVLSFLVCTILSAVTLWKPVTRWAGGRITSDADEGIEPFVGDVGTVDREPLTAVGGSIRLHGARMSAVLTFDAGVVSLPAGEKVRVVSRDVQQRFVVVPLSKEVEEQVEAAAEIAQMERDAKRRRQQQLQ
ncbi:MAG: NfeD family protein [Deltaproteobacteria bacterium]|nr:NfeD family protein [Deltaproteobacteria bacterium]